MLESFQLGSISGDIHAILAIFFVHVMATAIFRVCQVERTSSQSASQECWEPNRGVIVGAVAGCVVYPVVLLNILGTGTQHYDGQNAVSYP